MEKIKIVALIIVGLSILQMFLAHRKFKSLKKEKNELRKKSILILLGDSRFGRPESFFQINNLLEEYKECEPKENFFLNNFWYVAFSTILEKVKLANSLQEVKDIFYGVSFIEKEVKMDFFQEFLIRGTKEHVLKLAEKEFDKLFLFYQSEELLANEIRRVSGDLDRFYTISSYFKGRAKEKFQNQKIVS